MEFISVIALFPTGFNTQGFLYTNSYRKQLFFNGQGENIALPRRTILLDFHGSKFMVIPTYKEAMNNKNRILLPNGLEIGTRKEVIEASVFAMKQKK